MTLRRMLKPFVCLSYFIRSGFMMIALLSVSPMNIKYTSSNFSAGLDFKSLKNLGFNSGLSGAWKDIHMATKLYMS